MLAESFCRRSPCYLYRLFIAFLAVQCVHSSGFAQQLNPPTNLRVEIGAVTNQQPDATNTGYRNAPDYPGELTRFTGTIQSGQTYRFHDFPSGLRVPAGVHNVTFYGCRFASNAIADANVAVYGDNITFDYSTFEPSRVAAPPTAYTQGYQYGIDQRSRGQITVDHSDFWGWGNAIQFGFSSEAKPFVVRNSWFHDARDDGGIDHTDAILESYGGQSFMVFDNNTIVARGNTNGLALQNGNGTGYKNVTITNNYFSGFGYTVNVCGHFQGCSNITFTDNTFGTDVRPVWGPLYGWQDGNGNIWRRNRWRVVPNGYSRNSADDGKYWWPGGMVSNSDYSR
jgi:hypothetical protein